jgi:hydroxyethylthiazole kinase
MHAPETEDVQDLGQAAGDLLARVRERRPRVHCITNTVAQAFTANMLLALGAVPSMTIAPEEIADFVSRADALLVNLGTLDAERRTACDIAVAKADAVGVPFVLDPVFVDRSESRAAYAKALMQCHPRAIRLNAAEFVTLAGADDEDKEALMHFARQYTTTIGLTGSTDRVADGTRCAEFRNGHPLMAKVTAMGCAASALVAAATAVERDTFRAAAGGLTILGVAGEIAGERARGPGSFAVEIIDAVHQLDRRTLAERARGTP